MEFPLALPPQSNEAFLREVDEELRRDQMLSAWKRYGSWLIGAVVVGLGALGGYLLWQNHRQEVAGGQGERFSMAFTALASGNEAAAKQPLAELAASSAEGYRVAALMTEADLLLRDNKLTEAATKFGAVANDAGLAKPFRDLALVRQTAAQYDTLPPQVVIDRLRGLAVAGGPWFGSAGEMVGIAYLRMNRPREAGQLFGAIARDETVPDTLRQRAVQLAGTLGVDAVVQNEEKKAQ